MEPECTKNPTLLFSSVSALSAKITGGGGGAFASKYYGAVCVGMALEPDGEKWKRRSHSLGALWPPTSGEANCQRRAACRARSAKYLLGPGESSAASETLPVGST